MSEAINIQFGGVSNEPNDYAHEEGDLSVSINAVQKNGSLRPVAGGKVQFTFPTGWTLMLIHEYDDTRNYIFKRTSDNALIYVKKDVADTGAVNEDDATVINTFDASNTIRQVTCLKKIMCICTDEGNMYARLVDEDYDYLGALPEMPYAYPYLTTKIDSVYDSDTEYIYSTVTGDNVSELYDNFSSSGDKKKFTFTYTSDCAQDIYNVLFGNINAIRDNIHRQGGFCFPFYAKLAYRLYDGTRISITRPYLMRPSLSCQPLCIGNVNEEVGNNTIDLIVLIPDSKLSVYIDSLDERWKDIITGIDVFVSPEIISFTDSVKSLVSAEVWDDSILEQYKYTDKISTAVTPNIYNIHRFFEIKDLDTEFSSHKYFISDLGQFGRHQYRNTDSWVIRKKYTWFDGYNLLAAKKDSNVSFRDDSFKKLTSDSKYYTIVSDSNISELLSTYDFWISTAGKDDSRFEADEAKGVDTIFRKFNYTNAGTIGKDFSINLSRTDGLSVEEAMDSVSYYLVDSFEFDELNEDDKLYVPDLKDKIISNIETREVLEDKVVNCDWNSKYMENYNNRFVAVVDKQKYKKIGYVTSFDTGEDYEDDDSEDIPFDTREESVDKLYVKIENDGKTHIVSSESVPTNFVPARKGGIRYFSYKDVHATKLYISLHSIFYKHASIKYIKDGEEHTFTPSSSNVISVSINEYRYIEVPLKHSNNDVLSYAFFNNEALVDKSTNEYFSATWSTPNTAGIKGIIKYYNTTASLGLTDEEIEQSTALSYNYMFTQMEAYIKNMYDKDVTVSEETGEIMNEKPFSDEDVDQFYSVGNKVYQSEAENPFAFLNATTSLLPCDEIYKLAPSALPISQGQFGDYPMYAFADNGVWALKTGADGAFTSYSPISQDVCTNIDSVTQIDQSVLFVTKRGLMEIAGGQLSCLTESLNAHNRANEIPKLADLCTLQGYTGITIPTHIEDFLAGCKIRQDYKRQLIYVYNTDYAEGYVYSLNSSKWGMYINKLLYNANSYTDALAVGVADNSNCLLNMSDADETETSTVKSLVITRPVTFGQPDLLKTVEELRLRGIYDQSDVSLVIWASNDGKRWKAVGSSNKDHWRNYSGTPYKYFRLGVLANWQEQDSLNGITADVTVRNTNRTR